MTPEKGAANKHRVSGAVVLHTPTRAIPIKIDDQEYLHYVSLPDGAYVYDGPLSGHMVGPDGKEMRVIVGVTFVPGTDNALFTISAGTLGDEAELVLGKPFLTPEAHKFMTDQMANN